MILTLINWIYITLTVGIIGFGFLILLHRVTGYACKETDVCLFIGIALVTAYAEGFSLFCKVAGLANIVLILICVLICILCRKEIWNLLKIVIGKAESIRKKKPSKSSVMRGIIFIFVFALFWINACQRAYHADTDLYHSQTIRWIEEFGIVEGLGNLHHRFAYNSAFMPLQALYSWAFLINQSMHVMNAYLCMLVTLYALITCSCLRGKYKGSDCFKLVILLYNIMNTGTIASPGTDNFVLLFLLYILSKWCDYVEEKNKQAEAYGILCLLALYALTVKVSVAMILLLVIKPAVELLKEKRYKSIMFMIFTGIIILLPFCFRNFVISGYFLYPATVTGFFDVDWKMLPYSVNFDKQEITSRARGIFDIERYSEACNMSFLEWLPIWWSVKELWLKIMLVVNIVLLPVFLGVNIARIVRKNVSYDIVVNMTVMIQFIYWLMTAPNSRYGSVVLFLVPCMLIIHVLEMGKDRTQKIYSKSAAVVMGILLVCFTWQTVIMIERIPLKRSSYYIYRECNELEWEGITMYTPIENCYTGYYCFPGLTYPSRLSYLELRGDTIQDGFRIKEEYKNANLTTYGSIME